MKFGTRLRMRIDALDDHGRGIGQVRDPERPNAPPKRAEAAFMIPGEEIEGAFAGKLKGAIRLSETAVLEASPDRVVPECPHAGICGGCAWQHIRYERQVELKRTAVNRAFEAAGLTARLERVTPAKDQTRHRNRMDYVFGPNGELGLKEPGRWDRPVDLETCLLLSEEGTEVLKRVRAWARASGLPFWDNRTHRGYLRYLVIREGKRTGERMATLVTAAGPLEKERELVGALAPICTTVYHGINPSVTDLSLASELRLLHGLPRLHERIGGVTFAIHPNSFFQTNTAMAEVLLEHVRGLAESGPHARLLDLYCGSGFFSLALASSCERTLGIELDGEAIRAAEENAAANSIANAAFRAEAAERLSWSQERPDLTIVDPPRSGLHPSVRDTLMRQLPPRIVYISCNYRALATDLTVLLGAYDLADLSAFDLFPHTPHLETVAHLVKRV